MKIDLPSPTSNQCLVVGGALLRKAKTPTTALIQIAGDRLLLEGIKCYLCNGIIVLYDK
jgi:hypothetical protein